MFQVFSSLIGLRILEYHVTLSKARCGQSCNRSILYLIIRTIPVAAVEVMLAEVYLSAAPDVMVSRAALEVADPHSSVLEALIKQEQKERSEISASDLENLNEDAIYLQDLMRVLGTHFSKRDIDIYYQLTFERKKAVHVAEMMNLTPINVRQIRRRINTYLKEYFGELNDLDMPEEDE